MIKVRCPICDKVMQAQRPAEWPEYPFCSKRCRLIDLKRWLGEEYRIPPAADGEAPAQQDANDDVP